jgi:hypothetical protein
MRPFCEDCRNFRLILGLTGHDHGDFSGYSRFFLHEEDFFGVAGTARPAGGTSRVPS